jgi:uncharacterized integral membrane protein (TIGR00697 family)
MNWKPVLNRPTKLFVGLGGFFVCNALVAEFIGVKIFAMEESLGMGPWTYSLFGVESAPHFTIGVLLWPFVFVMTDVINEYYGRKGVRLLSMLTAGLISYAFIMIFIAIQTTPASWWIGSFESRGVENAQVAYAAIYGQGIRIILGSLVAFLVGQLLDVFVFQQIKKATGEKMLWLRATGSTLFSQFIDSFIVIWIAFGPYWSTEQLIAVPINNYILKVAAAILLTPVIYFAHWAIDRYLGKEEAERMKQEAMA